MSMKDNRKSPPPTRSVTKVDFQPRRDDYAAWLDYAFKSYFPGAQARDPRAGKIVGDFFASARENLLMLGRLGWDVRFISRIVLEVVTLARQVIRPDPSVRRGIRRAINRPAPRDQARKVTLERECELFRTGYVFRQGVVRDDEYPVRTPPNVNRYFSAAVLDGVLRQEAKRGGRTRMIEELWRAAGEEVREYDVENALRRAETWVNPHQVAFYVETARSPGAFGSPNAQTLPEGETCLDSTGKEELRKWSICGYTGGLIRVFQ